MKNIYEIAKKAGIPEEYVIPYGKDKAKIDLSIMDKLNKKKDGKLVLNMSGSMLPFSMSMDSGGHATLGYESAKDFYNKVIRGLLEKSTVYSIGGVYKE